MRVSRLASRLPHRIKKAVSRLWTSSNALPEDRDWLPELDILLAGIERPTFLDVGANRGSVTALLRSRYPKSYVHSCEPVTHTFANLKARFAEDALVRCHNIALGSSTGTSSINLYGTGGVLNSMLDLSGSTGNPFRDAQRNGSQAIQVETLDHFCARENIMSVDCIKIDTQGYDLEVLKGAKRLLAEKSVRVLIVEMLFAKLYESQASGGEIISFLAGFEYLPVGLFHERRVPYLDGQGARTREWYVRNSLNYRVSRADPIYWCDGLFCRIGP